MQLKELQRVFVRSSLQAARLPLTAAEVMLGQRDAPAWPPALAFDALEGGVKQVVGSLLRDEDLVTEGRLEQAKVGQARKAVELEAVAERQRAEADARLEQRRQADEQRRRDAERRAAAKESALERRRAEERRRVAEETAAKKQAARQLEKAVDTALTKEERAARRTRVAGEATALEKERQALAAKKAATRLDAAAGSTKAARKARTK